MKPSIYAAFRSEIKVRPDDIDLNNHVHSTRYLDYYLAARFEQMEENYKMSMAEFVNRGLNWVASNFTIDYKRPLRLGDTAIVETSISEIKLSQVVVSFRIYIKSTNKISAEGSGLFTLVDLTTGRATRIPEDVLSKYSV